MKIILKQVLVLFIIQSLVINVCFAKNKISLTDLALPTDVKHILKRSGNVYYSPAMRDKVLIPVNFWGEVGNTGLHFVPSGTSLIRGLSLAGGPTSSAKLSKISLSRLNMATGKMTKYVFDLSRGGDLKAHGHILRAGDTVFVKKSHFYENRNYYTGLIGVAATIISAIFIYKQIK